MKIAVSVKVSIYLQVGEYMDTTTDYQVLLLLKEIRKYKLGNSTQEKQNKWKGHMVLLTHADWILNLQSPLTFSRFAPVVSAHEGPVVESFPRHITSSLGKEDRFGQGWWRQDDADFSSPCGSHGDASLDVLQVFDMVDCAFTAIRVKCYSDTSIHRDLPAEEKQNKINSFRTII